MTERSTGAVNFFNSVVSSMIRTAKESRLDSRPQNQDACDFIILSSTHCSAASCSALEPMKSQSKKGYGSQSRISHRVSLSALHGDYASNTSSTDNEIRRRFHIPTGCASGSSRILFVSQGIPFLFHSVFNLSRMSFRSL